MSPFQQILANSLIQNVTNFRVWFALILWAFLGRRRRGLSTRGYVTGVQSAQ